MNFGAAWPAVFTPVPGVYSGLTHIPPMHHPGFPGGYVGGYAAPSYTFSSAGGAPMSRAPPAFMLSRENQGHQPHTATFQPHQYTTTAGIPVLWQQMPPGCLPSPAVASTSRDAPGAPDFPNSADGSAQEWASPAKKAKSSPDASEYYGGPYDDLWPGTLHAAEVLQQFGTSTTLLVGDGGLPGHDAAYSDLPAVAPPACAPDAVRGDASAVGEDEVAPADEGGGDGEEDGEDDGGDGSGEGKLTNSISCMPGVTITSYRGRRLLQCSQHGCTSKFRNQQLLCAHLRSVHDITKPYQCQEPGCGNLLASRAVLSMHMKIHSGKKPFKCDHPGCTAAFAQKSNLTRHSYVHTGERPVGDVHH